MFLSVSCLFYTLFKGSHGEKSVMFHVIMKAMAQRILNSIATSCGLNIGALGL